MVNDFLGFVSVKMVFSVLITRHNILTFRLLRGKPICTGYCPLHSIQPEIFISQFHRSFYGNLGRFMAIYDFATRKAGGGTASYSTALVQVAPGVIRGSTAALNNGLHIIGSCGTELPNTCATYYNGFSVFPDISGKENCGFVVREMKHESDC